jgi:hypothetical protein
MMCGLVQRKDLGKGEGARTKTTSILTSCRKFSSWDRVCHHFNRVGVTAYRRIGGTMTDA